MYAKYLIRICFQGSSLCKMDKVFPLTIITRDGNRPGCLKILNNSLKDQQIHHIILKPRPDKKRCFYNFVLNEIRNRTQVGWVMILDDDAIVIRKDFSKLVLHTIREHSPSEVLLFPSILGPKNISYPSLSSTSAPRKHLVDMSNLCVHSSLFQEYTFRRRCAEDYNFLASLHSRHRIVHRRDLPPLVWANYIGASRGRNRTCKLQAARKAPPRKKSNSSFVLYDALSKGALLRLARRHRNTYARAEPFPHIKIDKLIPPAVLHELHLEIPESSQFRRGCAFKTCFMQRGVQYLKSTMNEEARMGHMTRMVFAFFKSSTWISFLENLSGIKGIIPDPHFRGSGVYVTGPGGHLQIHANFNRYEALGLRRRLNLFLFLNYDWPEYFGGHLELWNRNMTACRQRILPSFGRIVIFSSTDFSYHGHPAPLAAPQGRMRRSLALSYFTNGCPQKECVGACNKYHSTLWQTPKGCNTCQDPSCKAFE